MNWLRKLTGKRPAGFSDRREAERALIQRIRDSGNDPTQANETTHYLYFANREAASGAASELKARGYSVELREPRPQIPDWAVVAKHQLVISEENVGLVRSAMEGIAAQFGGSYDGWEAAVQPRKAQ